LLICEKEEKKTFNKFQKLLQTLISIFIHLISPPLEFAICTSFFQFQTTGGYDIMKRFLFAFSFSFSIFLLILRTRSLRQTAIDFCKLHAASSWGSGCARAGSCKSVN